MGFLSSLIPIATGVAGLATGNPALIAAGASMYGGERANSARAAIASEANAFSAYQSSTAHQREVADLRAAGLNPILSATGGSGASAPIGQQWQVNDTISPAVSSALDAKRTQSTTDLQTVQARQGEPWAKMADVLSRIIDRLLPPPSAQSKSETPVTDAITSAKTYVYKELPEPVRRALPAVESKLGERREQLREAAKSLSNDPGWRDVYRFIRRGMLDNSAKSSFEDSSGKIHYNLTNREFHEMASKDPRYAKQYQGKSWK